MRSRKKENTKKTPDRNKRKTVSFQKAKLEKRLHQSPVEARYRTLDSRYVTSCGVCGYLIR
jgi:hypothetical protein